MCSAVRNSLLSLLCLAACGRSDLVDEAMKPDASVVMPAPVVAKPLFAWTPGAQCPVATNAVDLKPRAGESLVVVEMTAQGECSGLGGEWLIGLEVSTERHVFFGDHGCSFLPDAWKDPVQRHYGVARVRDESPPLTLPQGWCLAGLTGVAPYSTNFHVQAIAIYADLATASAAADEVP